jgi:hypothetical protein
MRIIFIACLLVSVPLLALAQGGHIGLYTDAAGGGCDLDDAAQGIVDIYVVHKNTPGAAACQFMVQPSIGFTATHVGDATDYLFIGNSQTGISIAYMECLAAPINVMTISYLFDGTSSACGYLEVVPDPAAIPSAILVVDCAEPFAHKLVATGGRVYVNADGSCPCQAPVPVQNETWGGIKALYR